MTHRLDSIHIAMTYAGLYEGRPSAAQMIEAAKKHAERLFGSPHPTLVLAPKITTYPGYGPGSPRLRDRLPAWQFIAWLTGPPKDERGSDGSQLIVIWWADSSSFELPSEVLSIDWNAYAEDYGI